ncbi:hypothetical protein BO85DRAFT_450499 [Aspergillus piperis CBS 112811]|uniref:Uncharacterized protein n=1 Tax=Aspergillus piperis CBS 112811 TaxID=1448313 RepID=A0A8G1QZL1_9EURO|nr:hypothetical protein BO85DRAFT_450499 [Aspergillus piperis CBS 112811]RAH56477.1 hypothetical protein BO85DRAFT_450499 [Aspergillus piperis CBS 112811]
MAFTIPGHAQNSSPMEASNLFQVGFMGGKNVVLEAFFLISYWRPQGKTVPGVRIPALMFGRMQAPAHKVEHAAKQD